MRGLLQDMSDTGASSLASIHGESIPGPHSIQRQRYVFWLDVHSYHTRPLVAEILKRLHAVRPVNGSAAHSQKDNVDSSEANVGNSLEEMLTKHAVLLVGSLELAPRPGFFAFNLHKMDVLLIECELTRVPDPGRRLLGWCCC